MNKKKLLVIPLEIYKREFFYTLYLSLIAIDKGFQVFAYEFGQSSKELTRIKGGNWLNR